MAAKKVDGVELANEIMLKDLEGFLVKKKFYTDNSNKPLPQADQAKKAKFDISKRGKLRKVLDEKEIKTRYDFAMNCTDDTFTMLTFGLYAPILVAYRKLVISQSFQDQQ